MNIELNTAYYIDGWEVTGKLTVEATVTDASFSYSYGSINAVQKAEDHDIEFIDFTPDGIAADLRRQSEYFPRMTRKRLRKFRRHVARRLAVRAADWRTFNDWLNDGGEKQVWEAYNEN